MGAMPPSSPSRRAPTAVQQNSGLDRTAGLPPEAYYSAWYYLPQTISVGTFWILFKFRLRTDVADPASDDEFFDLGLVNAADGSLTLSIYNHRSGMNLPIVTPAPVVPVSVWFQIEAYYRNAQDDTGRLTVWLDGRQVDGAERADGADAMGRVGSRERRREPDAAGRRRRY